MIRWILRLVALAAVAAGLWGLLKPVPAGWQPASTSSELREWFLLISGSLYLFFDLRLKHKAEQRAARTEARDIHDRRRRGDDIN